jgi:SAM-dependent methyltransferase
LKRQLLDLLVDPIEHRPMTFESGQDQGDERLTGLLRSESGEVYPVVGGIPRFVKTQDEAQLQTQSSFSFKWKQRDSYEWLLGKSDDAPQTAWLLEKYGFASTADWARQFSSASHVLDLGCGAGSASWPWLRSSGWSGNAMWVGLDISDAVDVAADLLGNFPNTHFVQADAMRMPFADGTFDVILSEGVLHHTPSTAAAISSAARMLRAGGEFYFYVYRRKGPIREFTDDYVREAISGLSHEEAWQAMRSLTELARKLSELHATVDIEADIPLLGIKAGKQDVQRLIYWNFAKLYWNDAASFEENVHSNFDWYRPRYAHRQTEAEVREWCGAAGLTITRFHEQPSGFTVIAAKS